MCLPSGDKHPSLAISPIAYANAGDHAIQTLPSGFMGALYAAEVKEK
jgi:hypothetical protein